MRTTLHSNVHRPLRLIVWATAGFLATLGLLTGCGGSSSSGGGALTSGGGSGGGGGGGAGVPGVSLGGGSVKGIVNLGAVVAEELDSAGNALREVGTATTGLDGTYALTLTADYEGGPILITMSADASTEMKCDVPAGCGTRMDAIPDSDTTIDFGEWYTPGAGNLVLMALIAEAQANDTIGASVTPFTDLAARLALASPPLDAAAVYDANSEISQLFGGIDFLNSRPVDITDPASISDGIPTERMYAALAAGLGSLADQTSGNPDWGGLLQLLADSYVGGLFPADDSGSPNDGSMISMQEIIDATLDVFAHTGVGGMVGVLITLQDAVDSATDMNGDGVADLDPEPSPTAGSPALTKVKSFISDLRTWGTVVSAEVGNTADVFEQEATLASDASDAALEFLSSGAMTAALQVLEANFGGTETSTDLADYGVGFTAGTINVVSGIYTITGGAVGDATVDLTATVPVEGSASSVVFGITSAAFRSSDIDADIDAGTISFNFSTPYDVDYAAIDAGTAATPDVSDVSIDIDLSLTQKADGSGQPLAAAVTFGGAFSTTIYVTQDTLGDVTWAIPSVISLGGDIGSESGHSFSASLTINIANAATFQPFNTPAEIDAGIGEVEGPGDGEWLDFDLSLSFELQLSGLPLAQITLSGDRTGFDDGTVGITIAYGARQLVLSGSVVDDLSGVVVLTITNQDAIVLTIDLQEDGLGRIEGDITFNGQSYATLTDLSNGFYRISYIDGTFETL